MQTRIPHCPPAGCRAPTTRRAPVVHALVIVPGPQMFDECQERLHPRYAGVPQGGAEGPDLRPCRVMVSGATALPPAIANAHVGQGCLGGVGALRASKGGQHGRVGHRRLAARGPHRVPSALRAEADDTHDQRGDLFLLGMRRDIGTSITPWCHARQVIESCCCHGRCGSRPGVEPPRRRDRRCVRSIWPSGRAISIPRSIACLR